jgi:hypothetical protein
MIFSTVSRNVTHDKIKYDAKEPATYFSFYNHVSLWYKIHQEIV